MRPRARGFPPKCAIERGASGGRSSYRTALRAALRGQPAGPPLGVRIGSRSLRPSSRPLGPANHGTLPLCALLSLSSRAMATQSSYSPLSREGFFTFCEHSVFYRGAPVAIFAPFSRAETAKLLENILLFFARKITRRILQPGFCFFFCRAIGRDFSEWESSSFYDGGKTEPTPAWKVSLSSKRRGGVNQSRNKIFS